MSLQSPPQRFKDLFDLVSQFNQTAESNHHQRLFYLQKITWEINKTPLNEALYAWLNKTSQTSLYNHLAQYQIDMDASFFLKGFQFASAIARHTDIKSPIDCDENEYDLMQKRDILLAKQHGEPCQEEYILLAMKLAHLAENNKRINETLQYHQNILNLVKPKIKAITDRYQLEGALKPRVAYKTIPLGETGNNQNFVFEMNGDKMIFRVEDRFHLGLEQRLHSFPVSKYFIEEYAVFRGQFQNKNSPIEFRPVVLSQFARQGNLAEAAKELKVNHVRDVAPRAKHFVARLTNLLDQLIDANAYHPDIKLTNFLVDGNRVLIADRKTLTDETNPLASNVRSSPLYAPDEYLECLTSNLTNYNYKAYTTRLNMPQFMSYQLGMVLREFLLLTQLDELPEEFRDRSRSTASYFENPTRPIINLSFLIKELTRSDPAKRMTIKQFNRLLKFINYSPENFYNEVEKVLPASEIGLQEDIDSINHLLHANSHSLLQRMIKFLFPEYYGKELLSSANEMFKKISSREDTEDRLNLITEKLARKCYNEYSYIYFERCSKLIESQLLKLDWEHASVWRKVQHLLTFGLRRVDRVSTVEHIANINIGIDLQGEEFQSHVTQLEFLSVSPFGRLGTIQAEHLKDFILPRLNDMMTDKSDGAETATAAISLSGGTMVINDESTVKDGSVVIHNESQTVSLPSGSVVINEDSLAEFLPSGSIVVHDDSLASSLPSGTMVINADNPSSGTLVINDDTGSDDPEESRRKRTVAYIKSRFFKTHKKSETELFVPPKPDREQRFVASVRTALTRLDDGSYSFYSQPKERTSLPDLKPSTTSIPKQ